MISGEPEKEKDEAMAERDLAKGIASTELEEGQIVAGMVDGRDVVWSGIGDGSVPCPANVPI